MTDLLLTEGDVNPARDTSWTPTKTTHDIIADLVNAATD